MEYQKGDIVYDSSGRAYGIICPYEKEREDGRLVKGYIVEEEEYGHDIKRFYVDDLFKNRQDIPLLKDLDYYTKNLKTAKDEYIYIQKQIQQKQCILEELKKQRVDIPKALYNIGQEVYYVDFRRKCISNGKITSRCIYETEYTKFSARYIVDHIDKDIPEADLFTDEAKCLEYFYKLYPKEHLNKIAGDLEFYKKRVAEYTEQVRDTEEALKNLKMKYGE